MSFYNRQLTKKLLVKIQRSCRKGERIDRVTHSHYFECLFKFGCRPIYEYMKVKADAGCYIHTLLHPTSTEMRNQRKQTRHNEVSTSKVIGYLLVLSKDANWKNALGFLRENLSEYSVKEYKATKFLHSN